MSGPLMQLRDALDAVGIGLDVWVEEHRLGVAYRGGELWWIAWDEATTQFERVVIEQGRTVRKPLGPLSDVVRVAEEIGRALSRGERDVRE